MSSFSDKITWKEAVLPKMPWQQPPDKVSFPVGGVGPWPGGTLPTRGEQVGNALTPTCSGLPAVATGPCRSRLPYLLFSSRNGLDFFVACILGMAAGAGVDTPAALGEGEGWEEWRSDMPLDPVEQQGDPVGSLPLGGRTMRQIRTWCWGGGEKQLCHLRRVLWVMSQLVTVRFWL